MNIIKPSAFMFSRPLDNSELETECLFGETIQILDKKKDWLNCKLMTDQYVGWIKINSVGKLKRPTHRVINKRTYIQKNNNIKSGCIHYLPLGSKICVKNIQDNWAEIYLSSKHKNLTGYVPSKHILDINCRLYDWVSIAEQLVGTPYKWGGRDSIGLDCSALLQLSYETYGENIPRNTNKQVNLKKEIITNKKKLIRGSVIFWKGHVGIMTDNSNLIHANAYHMKTLVEPLDEVISRMAQESKIVKMMNFN